VSQQAAPPNQEQSQEPSQGQSLDAGLETALRREWRAPFGVDVRLTLSAYRHGGVDPTYRIDGAGAVWRTSLTPAGPGTLRVTSRPPPRPGRAW
jgi:hypothetical protein